MVTPLATTARTRLRRLPELARDDVESLYAVLDAGVVAHVAVVDAHQPVVVPCAYARDGDRMLLHGSTGSRLFRLLAAGVPASVTVTLLDGFVYARSVFHSSMNYRSAMVFGRATALGDAEKEAALHVLAEHLLPGHWDVARPPSRKELAATLVVALPLQEASVKVSAGLPELAPEDADWVAWSGVLPLTAAAAAPVSADDAEVPAHVTGRRDL